ncbi:membrane-associated protein, putative [Bodo saltans]|uniref:Membrane-associated protein, putative n=1 Tax=Bodo saltans TaxID=75058 RepID=A0A0S4JR43_BODSA|nr:membrane-associated protein, putative [Bodo saltans]|eukprot:CUG93025.1 membrane-associated protein, putative [Bodo saltans]
MSASGSSGSFPGSGSAPSGDGSFSDDSKSKAWIAGVVVGVLVLIAVVVFLASRGSAPKSDDNYVPMNPATQV